MAAQTVEKDPWCPNTYIQTVAPFVPALTTKLLQLLSPRPTDAILDLGCGDGTLTARIAAICKHMTGLDSSAAMLAAATTEHQTPNSTYIHHDVRHLVTFAAEHPDVKYDKIVSNAALHWILRDATTRRSVISAAYDLLVPGGTFVAEMGAHGNVAEVHVALISALVHRGVPVAEAIEVSPWFFPTESEMKGMLEEAGFVVDVVETELRQTVLTSVEGGGIEGWVRLFGERFLERAEEGERKGVVREVVGVLEGVGRRVGGEVAVNYVRLRFVARRPE